MNLYFGKQYMKWLAVMLIFNPSLAKSAEFTWNGFGSFYGLMPLSHDIYLTAPEDTGGHLNLNEGDKLGLNIRADMGDGWSAIAQLVASGNIAPNLNTEPDWKPRADWFYVVYNPIEGLNLKFGRQIFPNWLASEFIDVGFTYPWRTPPNIVYRVAQFKSFMGGTVEYRLNLPSEMSLTGSVFGGTEEISNVYSTTTLANIHINNLLGATLTLDGDGWRMRAMASRSQQSAKTDIALVSVKGPIGTPLLFSNYTPLLTTYTIGGRYDKNNIVAYAEYGIARAHNSTTVSTTGIGFLESDWGTYGSLGYRIRQFLPWYMYSYADSRCCLSN